ncbi:BamA/OMP85 family outer membrane protein [Ectothiorhodospira mobilis]|uniref:BamA/OMP85 family outer membrane protein n=1 Tax=Ectothiorhodospira mobilis TaxID=195064 RepID=UPI001EE92DC3|nr:POTRA domain-containing protein [Ectothiorhodospira mobilis]MCG5534474.1 BamA/TamA family outer membrane protein [Ectothiorhodospira mobilis]
MGRCKGQGWWVGLLLLMFGASGTGAQEAVVVDSIRFEGNEVTREQVLRQELLFREGDPLDREVVEETRQALMNLGLFQSVQARVETRGETAAVVYHLEEKYYFFPLPRLSRTSDGDVRYGGDLRFDNFLGLNQRLRLLLEWEDAGSDASAEGSRRLDLSYEVPRLPGSAWGVALDVKDEHLNESGADEPEHVPYDESIQRLGVSVSRWLDRRGPSSGWRAGLGVAWEQRRYERLQVPGPIPDGARDITWTGSLRYTDVTDLGVRREGVAYGAGLSWGSPALGSSRGHQSLSLDYRAYRALGEGPLPSNLNYRMRLALASGSPFGGEPHSLGGSDQLRGYPRDYRKGDVLALLNTEYLRPVLGNPELRAVGFVDVGGVWPRRHVDLSDLHAGVGVGLRINLKWFVRTNLRLDYAYGIDARDSKVYAGTSHTF